MADTTLCTGATAGRVAPAASGTHHTDLHLAAALLAEAQSLLTAIARLNADPTIAGLAAITNDKIAEAHELVAEFGSTALKH